MKKRIIALLLTFVMVLSLVPASAFAADTDEHDHDHGVTVTEATRDGAKSASGATVLAFTSDIHNGGSGGSDTSAQSRLGTWLDKIVADKGGIDVMCFCGDMGSYRKNGDDYWDLTKAVMKVVSDKEIDAVYTTGNHEFYNGSFATTTNSAKQSFKKDDEAINGDDYRLYCLGTDNWDNSKDNYTDAQVTALTSYLNGAGNDKPIIILTHFPLHQYASKNRKTENADKIIDALNNAVSNNNQTIILLWGHNHSQSDPAYDQIYSPGYVLTYDTNKTKTINFYYAAAGCMSDSEYTGSSSVSGKGLVITINKNRDGNATLYMAYLDASGNELQAASSKATIDVTVPESTASLSGYVISIGDYALTINQTTDTLSNSGSGSQKFNYTGLAGVEYNTSTQVTADMLWNITEAEGGGFYITSLDGQYLNASYTQNSTTGYDGVLKLDSVSDIWTLVSGSSLEDWVASERKIKSTNGSNNANNNKEVCLAYEEGDTSNPLNLFTIRSTSNADTVKITAATVSIEEVPVTGVSIKETTASVAQGRTITLHAEVEPENANNYTATWSSNNTNVATVEANTGKVKGIAVGTATITVTVSDTNNRAVYTASLDVTVKEATTQYFVIMIDNYALSSNTYDGYMSNSSGYEYHGLQTATYSASEAAPWAILWTLEETTGVENGYYIKSYNGKYLSATYAKEGDQSGYTGRLTVGDTQDIWVVTADGGLETWQGNGSYLKSTNASDNPRNADIYLTTRTSNNSVDFFTVGSSSNYKTSKLIEPESIIEPVAVTGITVDPVSFEIEAGKTSTIIANVVPANADDKTVEWTSSDETVATVDANGKVKGKAAGTATITATTNDGHYTATCEVTVTPSSAPGIGYVITIGDYALSTEHSSDVLINNTNYRYEGLTGVAYDESAQPTENILWLIEQADGGYYIMSQDGRYLNAVYEATTNPTGCNAILKVDDTPDVWTFEGTLEDWVLSGSTLHSANANKYLTHEEGTTTTPLNLFTIRSTGESSSMIDPDSPAEERFVETDSLSNGKDYIVAVTKDGSSVYAIENVGGTSSADTGTATLGNNAYFPASGNESAYIVTSNTGVVWNYNSSRYLVNNTRYLSRGGSSGAYVPRASGSGSAVTYSGSNKRLSISYSSGYGGNGTTYYLTNSNGTFGLNTSSSSAAQVRLFEKRTVFNFKYVVQFVSNGVNYQASKYATGEIPVYSGDTPTRAENAQYTYTFRGWSSDGGTTLYGPDAALPAVTGPVTYVAQFTAVPKPTGHTVTFDSNGGTEIEAQTVADGETATEPDPAPTKEGCYAFGGWYSDEGLNDEFNFATAITTDITLYAKWNDAHVWGEPAYEWAPDYSTVTATRACTNNTSHVETETVSATAGETVPATCSATGSRIWTSAAFANEAFTAQTTTETLPIDYNNHTLVATEAHAATCTEAGNSAYWTCSLCGKYFSDAAGTTEIEENSWIIPSPGHAYGTPNYEWVETDAGYKCVATVECTICSSTTTGHTVTETDESPAYEVITQPTCGAAGEAQYTATFDNELFEEQTKPVTISATGSHTWDEGVVVTAATCSATGTLKYTCTVCGATRTEDIDIDPNAHSWDEGVVTTPASCTAEGVKTYTCAYNSEHTRTEAIPKIAHTLTKTDAKAATCTTEGNIEYWTCSVCGKLFSDAEGTTEIALADTVIGVIAHTPADAVEENRVEATCTATGSYDEVVYCSVCGAELSRTARTINALGHDLVSHEAKAATCTEAGWAAYDTCSRCDYTTYVAIPAIGHDWDYAHATFNWNELECTTATVKCMHDNSHETTVDVTVAVTVGEDEYAGLTVYTASFTVGENTYTDIKTVEGHVHNDISFLPWTDTTALPTTAGSYYLTADVTLSGTWNVPTGTVNLCLNGHTINAGNNAITINEGSTLDLYDHAEAAGSMTGNNFTLVNINTGGTFNVYGGSITGCQNAAVTTSGSFHMYGGSITGNGMGVVTTGSIYVSGSAVISGNLSTSGGETKANNVVLYGNGKIVVEGTLAEDALIGVYLNDKDITNPIEVSCDAPYTFTSGLEGKCSLSNFVSDQGYVISLTANGEAQAAPAHIMTAHAAVAATCLDAGSSAYWSCSACGKYYSDAEGTTEIEENSWIIEALGHDYNFERATYIWHTYDEVDYTCTATVVCTRCDQVTTGHSIIQTVHADYSVVTEPTCKQTGLGRYTATFPNPGFTTQTKDVEIPVAAHTLTATAAKDATCTEAGNTAYWTCSVCGKYFSDANGENEIAENSWIVPASGHNYEFTGWTWTGDDENGYTAAVATFTCTKCGDEQTPDVTFKITDGEDPYVGYDIYTASVTFEGETYTDVKRVIKKFTVSFDMNGHGEQIPSQTVAYGGTATKPDDPSEEGWVFDWYYTDPDFTTEFSFNWQITQDTVLYLKWTAKPTASITFGDTETTYNGEGQRPTVTVRAAGNIYDWSNPWSRFMVKYYSDAACTEAGFLGYDPQYKNQPGVPDEGPFFRPVDAGTYYVKVEVADTNTYYGNEAVVEFTIAKRAVTIKPTDVTAVYDGQSHSSPRYEISEGTLADGHDVSRHGSNSYRIDVGTTTYRYSLAKITNYNVEGGADVTENYDITFADGTVTITPAPLTITAVEKVYTYTGNAQGPVGTYTSGFGTYVTVEGLVGGDTLKSITLAGSKTNAGTYANEIVPSGAAFNYNHTLDVEDPQNYNINYVNATLTVTKAATNNALVSLEGWTYGEDPNTPVTTADFGADTATYTYSTSENGEYSATVPTAAGTYYVKATIAETGNYVGVTATASFTIAPASQDAPVVDHTDETISGKNDGTITGVTTAMEYSTDGGETWTPVTGETITGLAPGTYQVRYAATENSSASPATTVVIVASNTKLIVKFVDADGTEISSAEYDYGTEAEDITKPADPTKEADDTNHYTFAGWTPSISAVTDNATYTATYTAEAHNWGEGVVTTQPTCTEAGEKTYTCSCGKTKTETLPALEHNYQFVVFVWNGYTAQAKYVCANNSEHIELHDAAVTNVVTTPATCEADGIRTYTASYDGHTDAKTETLPATGHDWNAPAEVWNEDHSLLTVTFTCKNDTENDHNVVKTFSGDDIDIKEVAPTGTNPGSITYTVVIPASDSPDGTAHTITDVVVLAPLGTFTVSGKVTSFTSAKDETQAVTVTLSQNGAVVYDAGELSGTDVDFSFTSVEPGTYTLTISKAYHAAWTQEVTVVNTNYNVGTIRIHLLGDLNGDGRITAIDWARVCRHATHLDAADEHTEYLLTGYDFAVADINGDGVVTTVDAAMMNSHIKKVDLIW